ncbi:MAG: lipopolysaccharide heptosyltransferase II [Betaproteobacteria bacterium]|nr:lipopolysaccharide heptosyltransferase II [Betaproteobacteria bacterium]
MPRILVVAPNWIGDALMAQPLLARLREKLPRVRLDALAPAWVAPVLRRMEEVEEVIETGFEHGALELRARWRLGSSLRERAYDQAIVLPNSWKSALVPFFADIPLRSGYVGESRYGLLNLLYRRTNGERGPMALHYARLSEKPGAAPREPLPEPRLRVDAARAAETARKFGFAAHPRINAVFCPGAEFGPAKRWPAPAFGELAQALAARGAAVWLLGSATDAGPCGEVERASSGAAANLAGRTALDEAIELISAADVVVTNDSGLMHVAAAVGTPQVALFGSSSPRHTPPLAANARVVWLGVECSPCFARECPLGHFRCMREIAAARVLEELRVLGIVA